MNETTVRKHVTVDEIRHCARCGGTHAKLRFARLTRPCGGFTYWAACPRNGQPVLMGFVEENARMVGLMHQK